MLYTLWSKNQAIRGDRPGAMWQVSRMCGSPSISMVFPFDAGGEDFLICPLSNVDIFYIYGSTYRPWIYVLS